MLQVAGTMHWMAPEVLIHGRCTEKADIFRWTHPCGGLFGTASGLRCLIAFKPDRA